MVLATDGRYATQAPAQLEAAGSDATVVIASDLVASGADVLRVQPGLRSKATSSAGISSANGLRRSPTASFVAVSGLLRELRSVKDPAELARIEAAAALADAALADTEVLRAPGTTERQLGLALDDAMRAAVRPVRRTRRSSRRAPTPLPHARPSDRAFEVGDLLIVDVGALVDGYRSDMTRSFVIGGPDAADDVAREILPLVTEAQAAAVAVVAPGVEAKAVDDAVDRSSPKPGW